MGVGNTIEYLDARYVSVSVKLVPDNAFLYKNTSLMQPLNGAVEAELFPTYKLFVVVLIEELTL